MQEILIAITNGAGTGGGGIGGESTPRNPVCGPGSGGSGNGGEARQ